MKRSADWPHQHARAGPANSCFAPAARGQRDAALERAILGLLPWRTFGAWDPFNLLNRVATLETRSGVWAQGRRELQTCQRPSTMELNGLPQQLIGGSGGVDRQARPPLCMSLQKNQRHGGGELQATGGKRGDVCSDTCGIWLTAMVNTRCQGVDGQNGQSPAQFRGDWPRLLGSILPRRNASEDKVCGAPYTERGAFL